MADTEMLRIEDIPLPLEGGTHIIAAPDVVERIRASIHCSGEGAGGTPFLHGMPVHARALLPSRYWQFWQNEILLDSGFLADAEAPVREKPTPLLPPDFRPRGFP